MTAHESNWAPSEYKRGTEPVHQSVQLFSAGVSHVTIPTNNKNPQQTSNKGELTTMRHPKEEVRMRLK
jgi:hypothetical protein